jgi:anaerobic selenocysteine-containing dehydrogenase
MADYEEFLNSIDHQAYHAGEFQWEEDGYQVTRTYNYSPPGCHTSCGLLYYVKDGKVEHIEGDPLDPCANGKLCIRCLNMIEALDSPDRLKYPMKRIGERGQNQWERITWDEAYDIIETQVREIWEQYGGPSILGTHGTGRNINWQVPYFIHAALKSPNCVTMGFTGFSCYIPRVCGAVAPMGDFPIVDASMGHELRYSDPEFIPPKLIVVWGNEPLASNADGYLGHWLVQCVQMGSKLISVDPRLTWWGARAEYWLPVRPGTDPALAMAWLHVIVSEDLIDHAFVDKWCSGYDELKESVKDSTPAWAAQITGIPEADIIASARLFATTKPAALQWGLAFDQQMSAMALNLSAVDLMALTGNIDVPGGWLLVRGAFNINSGYSAGEEFIPSEWVKKKLTYQYVFNESAADFVAHCHPDAALAAVETSQPYPIKMWWCQSSNALACAAMDSPRLYEALKQIPFIVNVDPILTPVSVALADILLPVAMSPERSSARTWWTPLRSMTKVASYYEAKSDEEIILELGRRLNPEAFPWQNVEEYLDWYLTPRDNEGNAVQSGAVDRKTGIEEFSETFAGLQRRGGYMYDRFNATYRKFEKGLLRPDGQPGFLTPSGYLELTPHTYSVWGLSTVPIHREPMQGPLSTPELMDKYPLILTCGGRSFEFFHSEHRQQPTMREFHPWPLLTLHPNVAKKYGIKNGEWVWIENERGRFRQVANVKESIREDCVHAEHAWWFPEQEASAPHLFGTFDSNPNNLTRAFETGEAGIGSSIKAMICRIYPCKNGDEMPGTVVAEKGGWNKVVPGRPN